MNLPEFSTFLKQGWLLAIGPDELIVGWGAVETVDARASVADVGCVRIDPDFYLESSSWFHTSSHWSRLTRSQLQELVRGFFFDASRREVNVENLAKIQWVEPSREGFFKTVQSIREGFAARGLKKAVPVVHAEAETSFTAEQWAASLLRLLTLAPTSMPYGQWSTSADGRMTGTLGATPEILWNGVGTTAALSEIETVAVAGTAARGPNDAPEALSERLLGDPKERLEHQLVIDDIVQTLSPLGEVTVAKTGTVVLPHLVHLKTDIHVRFREPVAIVDLLKRLHPTPALGVSPRSAGFAEMRLWDDLSRRGSFGAPFGASWVDASGVARSRVIVAIRNVRFEPGRLTLSSGCGVVAASVEEREWNELAAKRDSVRKMLGLGDKEP